MATAKKLAAKKPSAKKATVSNGAPKKISRQTQLMRLQESRLVTLDRLLTFGQFLSCSFEPKISDVEIIVCFADLRGFTQYCHTLQAEMQDRKIQNFLRSYVRIFNEGLMLWMTQFVDKESPDYDNDMDQIAQYMVPTMYKHLGDGLMIVWEIPSLLDLNAQGLIAMNTIFLVQRMQERFEHRFRNLNPSELDGFSDKVLSLHMGFGMAKGHAWKLDFGDHVDYAGSVLNLAARLQDCARPSGIVAQADLAAWYFDESNENKDGVLVEITDIKGFQGKVRAWVDTSVDTSTMHLTTKPVKSRSRK